MLFQAFLKARCCWTQAVCWQKTFTHRSAASGTMIQYHQHAVAVKLRKQCCLKYMGCHSMHGLDLAEASCPEQLHTALGDHECLSKASKDHERVFCPDRQAWTWARKELRTQGGGGGGAKRGYMAYFGLHEADDSPLQLWDLTQPLQHLQHRRPSAVCLLM